MVGTAAEPLLQLRGVSKSYGGVAALSQVDFTAKASSIHAVLGENGAGKSTLIKVVAGVVQPDAGVMTFDGRAVQFASPQDANAVGIVSVFQELSVMPDLSVADNISITAPPRRFGLIDKRAQQRRAEELLARVGCEDVDPRERVGDLPLSRRQMVEIAKALGRDPKLLILDEGTSALAAADVDRVYQILHRLRDEGLALLYISHRMHEIKELADTISVLRNGRHVRTFPTGACTDDEVVQLMIGREISQRLSVRSPSERRRLGPGSRSRASVGRIASAISRSPSARARSSASAASTDKASANSCWRCSACCATSRARWRSTERRAASAAPWPRRERPIESRSSPRIARPKD